MTRANDSEPYLLCSIGTRIGALAVRDVKETMRPLPVEPLRGAPVFVLGLAIIRGAPTPVIDADQLLGATEVSPTTAPTRFVSLELGERSAALAVNAVLDVRSLPREMLVTTPPLLREAGADLVSAIGALDRKLLLVLEAARLVSDPVWSAIETPAV